MRLPSPGVWHRSLLLILSPRRITCDGRPCEPLGTGAPGGHDSVMGTTATVWVPLITAGLGLVTGLGAAVGTTVLTQRRTDRREDVRWQRERQNRQEQWQRERDERVTEERKLAFVERRAAYAAINRASRAFHDGLKYAVHRLRDGEYTKEDRAEIEHLRRDYRSRYAEAQMFVSEAMLDMAREINRLLAEVDAAVKRIVEQGVQQPSELAESLRVNQLQEAQRKLSYFTSVMRADLGFMDSVVIESHDATGDVLVEYIHSDSLTTDNGKDQEPISSASTAAEPPD